MFADDREKDCPYRIDSTLGSDLLQHIKLILWKLAIFLKIRFYFSFKVLRYWWVKYKILKRINMTKLLCLNNGFHWQRLQLQTSFLDSDSCSFLIVFSKD